MDHVLESGSPSASNSRPSRRLRSNAPASKAGVAKQADPGGSLGDRSDIGTDRTNPNRPEAYVTGQYSFVSRSSDGSAAPPHDEQRPASDGSTSGQLHHGLETAKAIAATPQSAKISTVYHQSQRGGRRLSSRRRTTEADQGAKPEKVVEADVTDSITRAQDQLSESSFATSQGSFSSFSGPATPATSNSTISSSTSAIVANKGESNPRSIGGSSHLSNLASPGADSSRASAAASLRSAPAQGQASARKGKRRASPSPPLVEAATAAGPERHRAKRTCRSPSDSGLYNLRSRSRSAQPDKLPEPPGVAQSSDTMSTRKGLASTASSSCSEGDRRSKGESLAAESASANKSLGKRADKGQSGEANTSGALRARSGGRNKAASTSGNDPRRAGSTSISARDGNGKDDAAAAHHDPERGNAHGGSGRDLERAEIEGADSAAHEDEDDEEILDTDVNALGGHDVEEADADEGVHDDMLDEEEEDDEMDDDEGEDMYDEDENMMDEDYGEEHGGGFGLNLRAMAGYMSGMSMSRLSDQFRSLLASLRDRSDPNTQLVALQELSEVLSISNEDTLATYFPTDSFVRELIYLMGGPKPDSGRAAKKRSDKRGEDGHGDDDDDEDDDEDADGDAGDDEEPSAAALAAAAGLEDSGEMMMLACRCLANLLEAMPYAAHSIIDNGAVPVLNANLQQIEFIDLAEQVLQTLEKLSENHARPIVREGGLQAMLQYLDFFNIHVQRSAMTAAANCCRKLVPDNFDKVVGVMPIICNVLAYSDQKLVESACRCIIRCVESYRHHPDMLEQILTSDVVKALNKLLLPNTNASTGSDGASSQTGAAVTEQKQGQGGSTLLSSSVYTEVLKVLSIAARASPTVAVTLVEEDVVETLYVLLTGSPVPGSGCAPSTAQAVNAESVDAGAIASAEQVPAAAVGAMGAEEASVTVADVAVLQNLASRPKEQIHEALSLLGELLPPLPRSGVFDSRMYTERAYVKRRQRSSRQNRGKHNQTTSEAVAPAAARDAGQPSSIEVAATARDGGVEEAPEASMSQEGDTARRSQQPSDRPQASTSSQETSTTTTAVTTSGDVKADRDASREAAQAKRVQMLRERSELVERFTRLVLPTLVEVYAASVALHVRQKALIGILKIISFVDARPLNDSLDNVPLASFIAAILASRDHPSLVLAALQMVELLTRKLPDVYSALLRREGVMWEIDDIASKTPRTNATASDKPKSSAADVASTPAEGNVVVPGAAAGRGSSGASRNAPTALRDASDVVAQVDRLLGMAGALDGFGSGSTSTPASRFAASLGSGTKIPTPMTLADAEDANIWRARILRDRFAESSQDAVVAAGADAAIRTLENIKSLVTRLGGEGTRSTDAAQQTLAEIAALFRRDHPISSFELLRSGLVEGLYAFATQDSPDVPLASRRAMLTNALMSRQGGGDGSSGATAAALLVRRLQETLSRLENVEIATALGTGGAEGSQGALNAIARQLRLKLVAEGVEAGEVPRSCTNIVVSMHAGASFQALHDYLRPKIAAHNREGTSGGAQANPSSRLQNVLSAFASGAGLQPPSAPSGSMSARLGRPTSGTESRQTDEGSSGASGKGKEPVTGDTAGTSDLSRPNEAASSSSSAPRRRSSRLSGKANEPPNSASGTAGEEATNGESPAETESKAALSGTSVDARAEDAAGTEEAESDEALARRLVEGFLRDAMVDEDGGFEDDLEDEGQDAAGDSSTVMLHVDPDAGKVKKRASAAQDVTVPEGSESPSKAGAAADANTSASSTRGDNDGDAAPPAVAGASSSTPSGGARSSYAAALQTKPSDWHLEFELEGERVDLGTTIYGAIFRMEAARTRGQDGDRPSLSGAAHSAQRQLWNNVYSVRYRKIAGSASEAAAKAAEEVKRKATPEPEEDDYPAIALPASVPADAPYAQLLQLLAVIHDLNAEYRESRTDIGSGSAQALFSAAEQGLGDALGETAFVNNKLTAKLNRQLDEPMIVASSCLPGWALDLPRSFPFLFPFEVRYAFLQSTSFGFNRFISRWQRQLSQEGAGNSRHAYTLAMLGGLGRQKVRIQRQNILASACKVLELYGTGQSRLEIEYFDEVGTGLGPTLEFYAMVSHEFARKEHKMWRDDAPQQGDFVLAPLGLFPVPMAKAALTSSAGRQRLRHFGVLGHFIAKALFDSRIIDVHFSPVFMRLVLNQRVPATMSTLAAVDPVLARSMQRLRATPAAEVESLGLDFTLPGQPDYELHKGGRDETVTAETMPRYVTEVLEHTLRHGVIEQVRAFRRGFSLIAPSSALHAFAADELVMLFGNASEDWSESTILGSVKPSNGYTHASAPFRHFVEIISSYDAAQRRRLLQWMTGSPRLPMGGFAALVPPLTVVKRITDSGSDDSALPTIMSCQNYLKLPPYSSKEVMERRLDLAIREGSLSFHLS